MNLKKNYLYNTVNQLLTMFVSIVTVPYVSRILGASNIGIYSYTYSIVSYFVMFITLGLNNYGNREIAKVKGDQEALNMTFSSIYFMQLMTGLIVLIVYFIYVFFLTTTYKTLFVVETIYVVAAIFDINWAMYGLEVFKFTAIRNMIISMFNLMLIFALVRNKNSLYTYTIILATGVFANQFAAWLYVRKKIKFVRISFKQVLQHFKPNLILFIPIVAVSLYKIMDKIMLGKMVDIVQVGYYENSEKIIRIPTILISSLGTVMLPRMANIYANNDEKKGKEYIQKSIDFAMILSSSLCFGIMAVSKEFVPLFYGQGYDTCIYIYIVLLPSCLFIAFSNVIRTQFLIPTGRDKTFIKAVITGAIINIAVNIIAIPKLLAVGAAVGTFIAESAVCISQAIDVRKELPIMHYVKRGIPFVLLGGIMFLVIFPIELNINGIVELIIKVLLGVAIYLVGLVIILKVKYDEYGIDIKLMVKKFRE